MIPSQFVSRITLQRDKVADFGAYPFCLPVVRHLEQLDLHPRLTFFVGENGSGKSTLLEALAVSLGFNAEGGSRNFAFSTRASHSELHAFLRVAKGFRRPRTGYFLRAESFFNVATEIERMDAEPAFGPPIIESYGGRSLHAQSHGESFMALLTERFRGEGLYILDEPEAALSPQRQLAAMARIHELVQGGAQFVIATHSPLLISYPDAWIYQCGAAGLQRVRAEDTEHFQLTRDFLANPDRFLRQLLD